MNQDYSNDFLSKLCLLWEVDLLQIRSDLPLAGSPERCEFRTVIEDQDQHLYILENIAPAVRLHKQRIASCLEYLAGQELAHVHPYLNLTENEAIAQYLGGYWQLGPYIEGIELQRPEYIHEGWRGRALAAFLQELRDKSHKIPGLDSQQPFSIIVFIDDFISRLEKHDPQISARIQPAYAHLQERLKPVYDQFPVHFCHGDLHPLNVIWSKEGIRAVIDWEFMGYKAEAYDAANLIGCLGMELPQGITDDLAFEFIQSLRQTSFLSEDSWNLLFEMVLALRFAWLSEWLHRNDPEMVELEIVYIGMLLENRDLLLRSWGLET